MSIGKKGQEGSAAGIVVIIIAIFLALYVIFLPPADREELLGSSGPSAKNLDTSTTSEDALELLSVSPGKINSEGEGTISYNIQTVSLFVRSEPEIKNLPPQRLVLTRGLFSGNSPQIIKFNVEDLSNVKKASLVFNVGPNPGGTLSFNVNNNVVGEVYDSGLKIVEVPVDYLDSLNELEISLSSPGAAFWKKNKISLSGLAIKLEFEKINTRSERQFSLSESDLDGSDKIELEYNQICNERLKFGSAPLSIYINDKRVFSDEIPCINSEETVGLDKELLRTGPNTMTFSIEDGDFTFTDIKINIINKDGNPAYQFSLTQAQYDDLKNGRRDIKLEMFFDNDKDKKSSLIRINEGSLNMNTRLGSYTQNIEDYVVPGTNFIRLLPTDMFTVDGLKVVIEK